MLRLILFTVPIVLIGILGLLTNSGAILYGVITTHFLASEFLNYKNKKRNG